MTPAQTAALEAATRLLSAQFPQLCLVVVEAGGENPAHTRFICPTTTAAEDMALPALAAAKWAKAQKLPPNPPPRPPHVLPFVPELG